MKPLDDTVHTVTARICARGAGSRTAYLKQVDAGLLQARVDPQAWAARPAATMPADLIQANGLGTGRALFAGMRRNVTTAEEGAYSWR